MKPATFIAGVLLACLTPALALADVGEPPRTICDENQIVSKDRLVTWALDAATISRAAEDWAAAHPGRFPGMAVRVRMVADEDFCREGDASYAACLERDRDAMSQVRGVVTDLVNNRLVGFERTADIPSVDSYLRRNDLQVRCTTATVLPDRTRPVPFTYSFPLRVRGSTDSINYPRDSVLMKTAAPAALSWSEDNIKDKETEKFALVVGLPTGIRLWREDYEHELVLYGGMSRDRSQVDGEAPSITTDTYQWGAAFSAVFRNMTAGDEVYSNRFTIRPDVMRNRADGSEVASLNLRWTPRVSGAWGLRLNDPFALNESFSLLPMVDVRFVEGEFREQGTRSDEDSRDFRRLGGQVGFGLLSDEPRFPFDLIVTETWMPSLRGGRDLEYTQARLSWALDPKKIFTVDLTWADGRRGDLDPDEDGWKLSIGAKY